MMFHMKHLLVPPLLALLAACEAPVTPEADQCGASGAQSFLGGPAATLLATTFTQPVRFIRPGDAVTMDFRSDRLNFDIDGSEVVTRAYCG